LSDHKNTTSTRSSERHVVRFAIGFAFAAVAASVYGKAFPDQSAAAVRPAIVVEGAASCDPSRSPRYRLSMKDERSGAKVVTASVVYQACLDTEKTADSVRSSVASRMVSDGINAYKLSIVFYDTKPFVGPYLAKYV
jgi:hypothetical protein